jgi:transcriptional regulator with XRE-family HTH domain
MFDLVNAAINEAFGVRGAGGVGDEPGLADAPAFDHDAPATHEEEQAAQPDLGIGKAKRGKRAAKEPKAAASGKRGVRKDGQPRRKAGTNPPRNEGTLRVGLAIAKARKGAGLTQRQLAEQVGMVQPAIANIERGVAGPSVDALARINTALGCEIKIHTGARVRAPGAAAPKPKAPKAKAVVPKAPKAKAKKAKAPAKGKSPKKAAKKAPAKKAAKRAKSKARGRK